MGTDHSKSRGAKWWIVPVTVLAVLIGVLVVVGGRYYPRWQQQRLLGQAREFLAEKDYASASFAVQQALVHGDRNLEAVRLMVEITEAAGSVEALAWRRRIVELQPDLLESHLDLAAAALAHGKPILAKEYLRTAPTATQARARHHELSGQAALALEDREQAEESLAEAVRLDPGNLKFAMELAALRIESPVAEVQKAAREVLEGLLPDPVLFRESSRLLIADALRQSDRVRALALSEALRRGPEAPLDDRLIYLGLLRQFERVQFFLYLSELQIEAAAEKDKLHALLLWLNDNHCASIALEWSKRLPSATLAEMPIPIALAESCVLVGDWTGLQTLVADPSQENLSVTLDPAKTESAGAGKTAATKLRWEDYEYLRLAYRARALREVGQIQKSAVRWNEAVQSASGRPEALQALAKTALEWKWERESVRVLWLLAGGVDGAPWALHELSRHYRAARSTRNLLRVATRMYELDSTSATARHQAASLSFLLGTNMAQALELAGDLHMEEPANPDYALTFAFGLHLYGRSEEGLAILRTISNAQLREPAFAAYYGVILAAVDSPAAAEYLALGALAPLLAEEIHLVEEARARHRGALGVRPVTLESGPDELKNPVGER